MYPLPKMQEGLSCKGVEMTENKIVKVAWIKNAPQRSIKVSALLPYGVGLTETTDFQ